MIWRRRAISVRGCGPIHPCEIEVPVQDQDTALNDDFDRGFEKRVKPTDRDARIERFGEFRGLFAHPVQGVDRDLHYLATMRDVSGHQIGVGEQSGRIDALSHGIFPALRSILDLAHHNKFAAP